MQLPGFNPVLSEPRRLTTPKRETLLAEFARIESWCKVVLALELLISVGLLVVLFARGSFPSSPLPWIAALLGGAGVFRWFAHHAVLNKKRLEHIRPDAQFGRHNRDSLLRVAHGVFARLGIPPGSVPVFLTRAKDVNAAAVRCELWPGKHFFNGVFLNRSVVHLLDEDELASVIGHELGHVLPYAPLISRWYALHALFAATVSFSIVMAIPAAGAALAGPLLILWILDRVTAYPHIRLSRGIEFLCDDFGARAAGLLPALSSEMKLTAESETRMRLMLPLYESWKKGTRLNLAELSDAYEEAIPFGNASPQEFEREFEKLVSSRSREGGKVTLGGFFNYVFGAENSGADDAVDEQIAELKLLAALPLVDLDRSQFLLGSQSWHPALAEHLASTIERDPCRLLFQLPFELDDQASTHPSPSRRILYLWRNRAEFPLTATPAPRA